MTLRKTTPSIITKQYNPQHNKAQNKDTKPKDVHYSDSQKHVVVQYNIIWHYGNQHNYAQHNNSLRAISISN